MNLWQTSLEAMFIKSLIDGIVGLTHSPNQPYHVQTHTS